MDRPDPVTGYPPSWRGLGPPPPVHGPAPVARPARAGIIVAAVVAAVAVLVAATVAVGAAVRTAANDRSDSWQPLASARAPRLPNVTPPTTAPPQPTVPADEVVPEDAGRPTVLPLPADTVDNVEQAGLRLNGGSAAYHFHIHLSVTLAGGAVEVPANLGIDPRSGALSPIHTHDATGIVHVESLTRQPYTLGQIFTEWAQPLGPDSIGHVHAAPGHTITWFVNGARVNEPVTLVLEPHDDIAAVETATGTPASAPPAFAWPAGY